jgi:predicted membrane-bound spermidine synthase
LTGRLCGAFLLSGAAALLFETLWFRLSGLALGNSVRASSAVLASFMAGLALGNFMSARYGERVLRPLRLYAALETCVALLGLGLVLGLPALAEGLAPLLGGLTETPDRLDAVRGLAAFGLMLLPATAMGATLPLLTRALTRHDPRFGLALGRLYGWNTLGGVAGAVAGETLLVVRLGLAGTAVVAATLNLLAAAVALLLDRASAVEAAESPPARGAGLPRTSRVFRLLAAAFLGGGILLALEVVWFRFLQLFVFGTQLAFALMLATVLAGIGVGGLGAAAWLKRRPAATGALAAVALAGGVVTILTYAALEPSRMPAGLDGGEATRTLWLSALLILPTSLVSGAFFTLLGTALRAEVDGDAAAAGWLTLANTVGAAIGAPLAGLVLLPWLGAEGSLYVLAVVYGLAAWALAPWSEGRSGRLVLVGAAAAFALAAALFPFGLMSTRFVRGVVAAQAGDGSRPVAFREGQTETALLLQKDWGREPVYQTLVTNAHSMSSTTFYGRRYMQLFAWWPLALRPDARRALLVSYGVGSTAEALTRVSGLERIDVVDISRTILDLSPLVARAGAPDPLLDPRVRVRVEDGRFHLLAGSGTYDIVTAEPPPPRGAGVVNLYTLEYFRLVRRRLGPGGIATHWLPVNQLALRDTWAIVRAFCEAFEDCSLWSGAGRDWMLAGTNGASSPASEEGFASRWRDTGRELRDLGVESPEDLGALFIADAPTLGEWTAGVPPLVDDRPGRLSSRLPLEADRASYRALQDSSACAERFLASPLVRRLWPAGVRERTPPSFEWRGILDRDYEDPMRAGALADLWAVLERSRLRTLPLLLMDSEPRLATIARARQAEGERHPVLAFHRGAAALAERDFAAAARFFEEAGSSPVGLHSPVLLRGLALGMAGFPAEAFAVSRSVPPEGLPTWARPWREWLIDRLGAANDREKAGRPGREP